MKAAEFESGCEDQASPGGDPLARARALAPMIDGLVDRIEAERQIPAPLLDALMDAGLYRLLLPRSCNGAETDVITFFQVIEEIAKHDASVAWCLVQASGCSLSAAFLRPDVAFEIFGRDPRAVLAWGPGPNARAVVADGGYRISGTWTFASGGHHATWFGAHAPIVEADGTPRRDAVGATVFRTMLFPAQAAEIIDVWQVIGLRGTGSDSFTVTDLFVPHERSVARNFLVERHHAGKLYGIPDVSVYAAGFAAVALGIARTTLDAFVQLARDKRPRGATKALRDNAVVQSQVGQAEARLNAARHYLTAVLSVIWETLEPSTGITLDQRMQVRLAGTHAIHEAMAVVDIAYHAAGATAIFNNNAFERRFRDMHTVAQQLQGRMAHFETVGLHLLGGEADTTFL
jgi:alkylation response protein AidB-like acyl-CoA dehydrogenase